MFELRKIRLFSQKAIRAVRFLLLKFFSGAHLSMAPGLGLLGPSSFVSLEAKGAKIDFGRRPILGNHVEIKSSGYLKIGHKFTINPYSRIVCRERICIGNNVLIARFVTILDHDHNYFFDGPDLSFNEYTTTPISIGNNVWIGDKVTVLKGVTIGNNVIIGANSLVNKDIPSGCIAAGNPCRVLRTFGD